MCDLVVVCSDLLVNWMDCDSHCWSYKRFEPEKFKVALSDRLVPWSVGDVFYNV